MSNITLDEWAPLLVREAAARRGIMLAIFACVALAFLAAAAIWEKQYASYVRLHVDTQNAVEQVAGVESAVEVNQASVAKELLFSREIMDRILAEVGYINAETSAVEGERIKEEIIKNTEIFNINNQLLEIVYQHPDPKIAFDTTSLFGDLFLQQSMNTSSQETSEAFDFIVDQVETYRTKLEDAEARLESFRGQYPGISTSTEGNVDARIVDLRRDLEKANLKYNEFNQRRKSLERQLSTEASSLAAQYETSQTRARVSQLQSQIDLLRLSYTDDYPDIVRLKDQIAELIAASNSRTAQQSETQLINLGGVSYQGAGNLNPVYQQMRSDLARVSSEADAQRALSIELQALLNKEINRSSVSGKVERQLTELSRDYAINKELYEDLLRRQESARLSMSLSAEKQGVLFSIQEPANFPILPTGLRFMHIALMGIVLGLALPIFYLVAFLKLDPRIRTSSAITDLLELPLLTTVPHMAQPHEKPKFFNRPSSVVGVIVLVIGLYVLVAVVKYMMTVSSQGAV